ncbi:MAG: type I-B CRISPR-associated protein Cas7/Csh2 [Ectobacillus sp.]
MNNSEILFLYDAKLCNPNGDPEEENRPRIDYERGINLVSDLRLKRYIRDYFAMQGEAVYVSRLEKEAITAEQRVKSLGENLTKSEILQHLIDVRLFGATIPVKKNTMAFTGPVQFNWGYSLNQVELLEASITSNFASGSSKIQGAIGKDYRVKYSLLAFAGVISGHRAKHTFLQEDDIKKLDRAMKYAIPLAATRSKVGQYPRLYIRVEYKDNETVLGDMRDFVQLESKAASIRDIRECTLHIGRLISHLHFYKERIQSIYYMASPSLYVRDDEREGSFIEVFGRAFSEIMEEIG